MVRRFETGPPSGRGRVPEIRMVFAVCGRVPWAPGLFFYPPGPILGSVFLWRCFSRQKPPCWVPEGSLAGFLGCVFEVWPAPGAWEGPQKGGGRSPPHS